VWSFMDTARKAQLPSCLIVMCNYYLFSVFLKNPSHVSEIILWNGSFPGWA
jgi:hypothetical protein